MTGKEKYIDVKKVIADKNKKLAKWLPSFILKYIKRIVHEKEVNLIMNNIGHLQGLPFVKAGLEQLNTKVAVKGTENIPKTGGVILAANHPLGGLDGIAFMQAVSTVREDMSFLVNDILLNIKNFEPLFLPVNKHGSNPREAMKLIDNAYASDKAVMIFPAGLVSRKLSDGIADLEWKKSFINKAIQYQRDVIPVHIEGKNSKWFYALSVWRRRMGIKANLEMFYLADEMFKQRNKTITVTFGKPIPYSTFNKSKTLNEWATFVRNKVYNLAKD